MRLSTRIKCFKYLVYAYIILISICGGAELLLGAFLLWNHRQYTEITNNLFWEPFATILCLGLVTLLLCYLGWISTSKKNRCYLGLFCGCLVLLIVVQFLTSGWAIALRARIASPVESAVDKSFAEYLPKITQDQALAWDRLQKELRCCGVGGPDSYRVPKIFAWSCYDPLNSLFFQKGCLHVLTDLIENSLVQCAIVAVAAAMVQSLGIFCVIQLSLLLKRPTLNIPQSSNQSNKAKNIPREQLPLAGNINSAPPPPRHHHHPPKPNAPKIETMQKSPL